MRPSEVLVRYSLAHELIVSLMTKFEPSFGLNVQRTWALCKRFAPPTPAPPSVMYVHGSSARIDVEAGAWSLSTLVFIKRKCYNIMNIHMDCGCSEENVNRISISISISISNVKMRSPFVLSPNLTQPELKQCQLFDHSNFETIRFPDVWFPITEIQIRCGRVGNWLIWRSIISRRSSTIQKHRGFLMPG